MSTQCYVCRDQEIASETAIKGMLGPSGVSNTYRVTCPRCGVYDITDKLKTFDKDGSILNDKERLVLSHAVRRATDAHGGFAETLNLESVKDDVIARHPLPDPVEQADHLIDYIARHCTYGELTESEHPEAWAARVGVRSVLQLKDLYRDLLSLIKQEGLGVPEADTIASRTDLRFGLTMEGWKRARELRQRRGPGNQAFVAMWFHPGLLPAYTDGFVPALTDTGHRPFRVDFAAHNNKIDDVVVAEIRRSQLVIVDTTGARPNAYWEAGFAMGLGIPVLWCCNESWDAHVQAVVPHGPPSSGPVVTKWSGPDVLAFDTRQHAFTFWSDPADLREKLTARIRALGFDAAWNRGQW